MGKTAVGKKVPAFSAITSGDKKIKLSDFRDAQNVVLYFYPKDNTPGCTTEGQNFRDLYKKFKKYDTEILGVSKDSIKKHDNFIEKHSFPFALISDPDEKLCKLFDVIKEKNMYGKKYMGIERSTFLIDKSGKLAYEWRKVRVKGHVEDVLEQVQALEKQNA